MKKITFEEYKRVMKFINELNVQYYEIVWTKEDTIKSFKEKVLKSISQEFSDEFDPITKKDLNLKSKGEGTYDVWCSNIGGIIIEKIEKIVDVELEYYDFNTVYTDSELIQEKVEVEKIIEQYYSIDKKMAMFSLLAADYIPNPDNIPSFNTSCRIYNRVNTYRDY